MLLRVFLLGHIEVEIQGRAYDLHNFCLADSIIFDAVSRELVLRFTRRTGALLPSEEAAPEHMEWSYTECLNFKARASKRFSKGWGKLLL